MFEETDNLYSESQQRLMCRPQHRESGGGFPSQSVLCAVQRFVNAVTAMNETVMMPSRLLDMDLTSPHNTPMPLLLQGGDRDPYAVYALLNSTKNDLMYGMSAPDDEDLSHLQTKRAPCPPSDRWSSPGDSSASDSSNSLGLSSSGNTPAISNYNNTTTTNNIATTTTASTVAGSSSTTVKQPCRRQSTLSMASIASASSDSGGAESEGTEEAPDEVDSAIGAEDSSPASVTQASAHLRGHLLGLYGCLTQMSETALYITERYQDDIGP